ncbi:MAG: MATE family efflux transporter [Odoribacter sp.]|nr:MATE family efflux transporter [Odoribacter sp.]
MSHKFIQNIISLKKKLFSLSFPIFIETLLIMLLGSVDIVMLNRYSDNAVAAVGVVNQLVNMVFLVFAVTTLGTSVLCSQYLGAKQKKNITQTIGVSVLFNFLLGIGISIYLFFQGHTLLSIMDLSPELMIEGLPYIKIVGGFAFIQAITLTISAILRSHNLAYYPMRVTLIINILNVIGNYILIFGKFGMPALGVQGAAISTSLCRIIAMIILSVIMLKKVERKFPISLFKPFPWDKVKNLLTIGLPAAGEQVSYNLSQVVVTYFTIMAGTVALTTRTYVMNIVMFTYLFAIAIGQGGAICIGHLVGAEKQQAAYILQRYCLKWSIIISLGMAVITAALGPFVLNFLTDNPDIIHLGIIILCIDVILEVGRAVNILSVNVLNAVGDVYYPFYTGVIVMWVVATYLSYLLGISLGWGLIGMWIAFTLDENIRAIVFFRRWKSRKWEGKSFTKMKNIQSLPKTAKAA